MTSFRSLEAGHRCGPGHVTSGDYCIMGLPDHGYYQRLLLGMYYLGGLMFSWRTIPR